MGGNIFGANPGDGGCGPRPEGLVADDLVGTWQGGSGVSFTLKADGGATGAASLLPPPKSPTASGSPAAVQAAGTWTLTLQEGTELAFVTFFDVKAGQRPATFGVSTVNVSGTRTEPWMYTFGDGDPDSCDIIRYERG
jgi:hypothetical protein